eukprot:EC119826.1.p1 GENE.EC119826.1~~EC119826.1.p1  ORF type:complete len:106 (+),score=10.86 EC119826.1:101-418(+)
MATGFKERIKLKSADQIPHTQREDEYASDEIDVTFHLPDGSQPVHKFRVAQLVDFIKLVLQEKHGLKFASQVFLLNGTPMPDPLSLNDFPQIIGKPKIDIEVKMS